MCLGLRDSQKICGFCMSIWREESVAAIDHGSPVQEDRDEVSVPFDLDAAFLRFEKVLRRVASRSLSSSSSRSSQTTALVNEAWMRLDAKRNHIADEQHLLSLAVRVLDHLAVDRHRSAIRRKTRLERLSWDTEWATGPSESNETIDRVEAVLEKIADHSPRAASVAKLKLFASMTIEQIATALGTSERTVSYDWKFARAMLESGLKFR